MHFADLTSYSYGLPILEGEASGLLLNVGWLDSAAPFERGAVPAGFIERLKKLVSEQHHAQTWGFHLCPFCKDLEAVLLGRRGFKRKLYDQYLADGRFSSAEIRVEGDNGRWYASPRMIAHYVGAHGYKPPDEFVKAVMKHAIDAGSESSEPGNDSLVCSPIWRPFRKNVKT
jgi:hypothetical protein